MEPNKFSINFVKLIPNKLYSKLLSLLRFILNSKNKHGIHSPFVFDLVTKCFNKKLIKNKLKEFNSYKKELILNNSKIEVTDLGAGSKIFSSNKRKISKIAKHAGISNKRAKLLLKLIQYFKPNNILEIGTSLGLSTSILSIANSSAKIITLEGCEQTAKVANEMFQKHNFKNIELVIGNFEATLPKVLKNKIFDFIYFDGNHTKKGTLKYFELSLNSINNNSVLLFDDIHWNKEMEEAWEEIKNHPKVRVTIDTYQWGFVLFRKEQQKEHFIIRV